MDSVLSVLPSTVEEINILQNSMEMSIGLPSNMYVKEFNKGFENIVVDRTFKREVSLPNGVQNWNISNFDEYFNFDDNNQTKVTESPTYNFEITGSPINNFEVIGSPTDRLVPADGDLRQRCGSFSSVSSSMDDKSLVYRNLGIKTIHMDSGSTCISTEHNYVNTINTGLEVVQETFQDLDTFFKQVPKMHNTDSVSSISPVGSPLSDSNLDYSTQNNFSVNSNCSQDSFSSSSVTLKRSANTPVDELFFINPSKRNCESPSGSHYLEGRKKNNIASKNCRKTRKEKQKEMEIKASHLEKENGELHVKVRILEEAIHAHKLKLFSILPKKVVQGV